MNQWILSEYSFAFYWWLVYSTDYDNYDYDWSTSIGVLIFFLFSVPSHLLHYLYIYIFFPFLKYFFACVCLCVCDGTDDDDGKTKTILLFTWWGLMYCLYEQFRHQLVYSIERNKCIIFIIIASTRWVFDWCSLSFDQLERDRERWGHIQKQQIGEKGKNEERLFISVLLCLVHSASNKIDSFESRLWPVVDYLLLMKMMMLVVVVVVWWWWMKNGEKVWDCIDLYWCVAPDEND